MFATALSVYLTVGIILWVLAEIKLLISVSPSPKERIAWAFGIILGWPLGVICIILFFFWGYGLPNPTEFEEMSSSTDVAWKKERRS